MLGWPSVFLVSRNASPPVTITDKCNIQMRPCATGHVCMSHESRVWQIKKHIMAKLAPNLPPSNLVSLVMSLKRG